MAQITLYYELAIAQAVKLEQAAEDCASISTEVRKQIAVLNSAWSGDSATRMLDLLEQWCKDNSAMESKLRSLAKRVRGKADAIKAADEAAVKATQAAQTSAEEARARKAADAGANAAAMAAMNVFKRNI